MLPKNNILKLLIIQPYPLWSLKLSVTLLKANAASIFSYSSSSKADDLSIKNPSPQMTKYILLFTVSFWLELCFNQAARQPSGYRMNACF